MPGTNLKTILASDNLSGVIQKVKPGLPMTAMPTALVEPTGAMLKSVEGDYASFRTERGTRQAARRAESGAPSRNTATTAIGEQMIKLICPRENFEIKAVDLQNLDSMEGQKQRMGEQEVARQLANAKQRLVNARVAAAFSAFALGALYYDANGNILGSSSGALVTVDMGIPAGNKNQINGIINTSWSNPAADIVGQVQNIRTASLRSSGHVLKHAMYGSGVVNNILNNNVLGNLIRANPAYQIAFANQTIPEGFLGMTWWPAYESFWASETDSIVEPFGTNQVTFCPDPSESWYEITVGSTAVPRDVNVTADPLAAISNLQSIPGQYAYAYLTADPVKAITVYGDCFLPFIKTPTCVYQAVTVF
jgi:hypothetical protein